MTFKQSIKTCLVQKYLFVVRGRATRSEFWWFMLFAGLVNFCSSYVASILPPMLGASIYIAVWLMLLPANFGVTVRRLHDRNLRGWWLALPIAALVLWTLAGAVQNPSQNILGNILSMTMCLCYLAIFCMPGQKGENRFGPDPLAEGPVDT